MSSLSVFITIISALIFLVVTVAYEKKILMDIKSTNLKYIILINLILLGLGVLIFNLLGFDDLIDVVSIIILISLILRLILSEAKEKKVIPYSKQDKIIYVIISNVVAVLYSEIMIVIYRYCCKMVNKVTINVISEQLIISLVFCILVLVLSNSLPKLIWYIQKKIYQMLRIHKK